MHLRHALPLVVLMLLAPHAAADPSDPALDGLGQACGSSGNEHPCRWLRVIPNTTVAAGETKRYANADFRAEGTIVVTAGGTVLVENATIAFENTSAGIIVQSGGTLRVFSSLFTEFDADTQYAVELQPLSKFVLNLSTVRGGTGVRVATNDIDVRGNVFERIPVALRLTDVDATVERNHFRNNSVAVNQTGGTPRLQFNSFSGGDVCVRDWRTNPSILNNTFRGCHVGILHQESESVLSGNDMDDDEDPVGVGMLIENTRSPFIEDNRIGNYGTGILIVNARAFIRNNVVHSNVGDGILVQGNSAPMYIDRNVVRDNGGNGIRLVDAVDVPVTNNTVENNGGHGIVLAGASTGSPIVDNLVRGSGGSGIVSLSASAVLARNVATGNALDGIVVEGTGSRVEGGDVSANTRDGLVLREGLRIEVSDVLANGNGDDGVHIERAQASIERVNASLNAANGFRYDPKGPWEPLGKTDLTSVRALGNGASGLYNVAGNATIARNAWWEGNKVAGVKNDDLASLIDARECYWGSATGPTHIANPLGTGDRVEGGVLYVPFLTAPPA